MKANFGLLPPLEEHQRSKRLRYALQAERSTRDLDAFIAAHRLLEDRVADNVSAPMQVS
jgi:folate-dependent tRNA-U54 methylase TrmFO/GidA